MTQETDLLVTASGTPVGLLAVLVEELERAGSLSHDQVTRRLEASPLALTAQTNHDRRAGDKLEAEFIVGALNALARRASVPRRPTVVGGISSERLTPMQAA